MTEGQSQLIDKSLGAVGKLALAGLACLIAYGLLAVATGSSLSFKNMITGLFDWDDAGFLTYPLAVVGVASLWIRKFLRAGKAGPPTA